MSKPAFRQISGPLDVPDEALSRISDSLGVPVLAKVPAERPIPGPELAQDSPNPDARPSPTPKTPAVKKPAAASIVKLSVNVPAYVVDAIRLKAAQERSTSRQIVLLSLQALGFVIEPGDLFADGRRPERKRKR
jgi:hypothetical protein